MSQTQSLPICIFWMRRDLRLFDSAALYHALKKESPVLCVFIYDKKILDQLENKHDKRVTFIHDTLSQIKKQLNEKGSDLLLVHDSPENAWKKIVSEYNVKTVFANRDYEPYAVNRDKEIAGFLGKNGVKLNLCKDQVIFEPNEITKPDGTSYVVYTPFSNKWLSQINSFYLKSYPVEKYQDNLIKTHGLKFFSLDELGFKKANFEVPPLNLPESLISRYSETRDFPAIEKGTSHLGLHLRFGTVSIRQLASMASELNQTFLKELIWREFFMHILFHYPRVENQCFRKEYENIRWRNNEEEFEKWCNGKTGYPLVDAGMRELNETGFMHNRVRMVVASFLCKHLLIDWRWGERYFAEKLLDYDLSANVGNWQWAAGCGCDAAPYFRVFNPQAQAEKFDSEGKYIRKWVPELDSFDYPQPIVDHKMARDRVLEVFKQALNQS
jgi:deoxyribodipyrimidine photo-lyase